MNGETFRHSLGKMNMNSAAFTHVHAHCPTRMSWPQHYFETSRKNPLPCFNSRAREHSLSPASSVSVCLSPPSLSPSFPLPSHCPPSPNLSIVQSLTQSLLETHLHLTHARTHAHTNERTHTRTHARTHTHTITSRKVV